VQTFVWQDLGGATLHNKSFTKIVKLLPGGWWAGDRLQKFHQKW